MDWDAAITKNREALKRVLAALIAMVGLAATGPPFSRLREKVDWRVSAKTDEGFPAPTLPRRLHLAVLRLLRPAEAAVRRLVIVVAREIVVTLPPVRPRKPKPKSIFVRNGIGTGIVMPPNLQPGQSRPRTYSLPLTDPLRRLPSRRRRPATALGVPRISMPGFGAPFPFAARRSGPVDATRLALRLAALGRALDDLPREARRFARWRCRVAAGAQNKEGRDAGRIRRPWPLRTGRSPGQNRADARRPTHEVHDILNDIHGLAFDVLERPDTS